MNVFHEDGCLRSEVDLFVFGLVLQLVVGGRLGCDHEHPGRGWGLKDIALVGGFGPATNAVEATETEAAGEAQEEDAEDGGAPEGVGHQGVAQSQVVSQGAAHLH